MYYCGDYCPYYPSEKTLDLFDTLHNMWDRFRAGFIYFEDPEEEIIVNCPYCNEDYAAGRGQHIYCEHCQ